MTSSDVSLSPRRARSFSEGVREEYDRATIVEKAVPWRPATEEDREKFVRIGRRFYAGPETFDESYSTGERSYSARIMGVGHSIAIGEEKYFISSVTESLPLTNVQTQAQMLDQLDASPIVFEAAFLPLKYYMDFHEPDSRARISYDGGPMGFLRIGRSRARVFWSSKYVPFREFVFIGKGAFEWLAKMDPGSHHRVRVKIELNVRAKKFDVVCDTVAYLKDPDRSQALSFAVHDGPKTPLTGLERSL